MSVPDIKNLGLTTDDISRCVNGGHSWPLLWFSKYMAIVSND